MAEPVLSPVGARLRERTQPLAPDDADYGWAHAHLCEAIGLMLEQVAEVFDPEGDVPPLAPILDPELCPEWALPWLAQFVGVAIPPGTPPEDARTLITDVAGFRRGTPAAMRAAASALLTDTKTVWFRERDTGAYQLEVVTLTSETPDPRRRARAMLTAQKPGGIVLRYACITGQTYRSVRAEVDSYRELRATWTSYRDLRDHLPLLQEALMPDHFTSRLALPYPDLDDPADVPVDLQQLAERLDLLIPAGSGAGLALNRAPWATWAWPARCAPAASSRRRLHQPRPLGAARAVEPLRPGRRLGQRPQPGQ
jgi:hypothetical protein